MGTIYRRDPDGKGNYHAEYTTPDGRRIRRTTGTRNRKLAESILRKWEEESVQIRHDMAAVVEDLPTLIAEYEAYLAGSDPKHVRYTKHCLQVLAESNGWTKPSHITQYQLETTVRQLQTKDGKPIGLRTQGHYIGAAKAFTRWLRVIRRAITVDPLEGCKKPNPGKDRRYVRRFLLQDEWTWLSKTPNALLYATAIQTGLRSSELRHVRSEHLRGDRIELPAKFTKNKQLARQYITGDLATGLKGNLPFAVEGEERLAELLRKDLAIARWYAQNDGPIDEDFLAPIDARGHYLDFHSLRHTCGAWLVIADVNVKVVQKVMRHSSITLTLDTYGHLMHGAERDAVQRFARVMKPR